ncbi:MAG: hypothetical protein JW741_26100, partial [Sedimentisphaerales bacterium]|nr:hypothetical protein [Sedimentisphaerales bacterium]
RHYNENISPRNWPIGSGSVLVRESPESLIAVEGARIRRVDFQAEQIKNTIPQGGMAAELRVELAASSSSLQTVTAHYLAKGVTWAPSYQVDISAPNQATLSAKALVLNEIADMQNVDVVLVTGYPHLQFTDIASPFFLKQDLAAFLNALSQGRDDRREDMMANVMRQAAFPAPGMGGGFGGPMPDYGAAQPGLQTEDLFLYPAGTLNLERDAVAYVPLFSEPVPYEHVYTWDIPDYLVETRGYQVRGERRADEEPPQIVWHVLRLENTTDLPWTTAPAATVKDGMILGQDTLTYTAPGMKRDLRITQAVNVIAEEAEREVSRERDAMNLYGRHFDQATIEGQLSVTSHQAQTIKLEITKTLSGEVLASTPQATIDKPGKGLMELNSLRVLKWQVELAPNQSQEITYKYELYVPR